MNVAKHSDGTEYSIAAVSKLTGVSCHALRVWERRYSFPVPHRSASGHRRYSQSQVQVLRRISDLARQGHAISALISELRDGQFPAEEAAASDTEAALAIEVSELIGRLIVGDLDGGEVCFERLETRLDPGVLVGGVIALALVDIGERWFRGECDIYQERCVSIFLQRKLQILIDRARRENVAPGRNIVIGTMQGDRHVGGVLIVHLMLERAGWRVLNVGFDLPAREYQKVVARLRPDALGLSFVLSRNINKRFNELAQIKGLPVFVGGRSILNYQGLARRHGLIPLPGEINQALVGLETEFQRWREGDTMSSPGD